MDFSNEDSNREMLTGLSNEHNHVFACSYCSKTMHLLDAFVAHEQAHKLRGSLILKQAQTLNQAETTEQAHILKDVQTLNQAQAVEQGHAFRAAQTLNQTVNQSHTLKQAETIDQAETLKQPEILQQRHPLRNLKCTHCGKKFRSWRNVLRHERLHTGEKPYSCEYCDQSFIRSDYKVAHEQQHRAKMCLYCFEVFSNPADKTMHEMQHICVHCYEPFPIGKDRLIHQRVCTERKRFACTYCQKTFSNAYNKTRHEKLNCSEEKASKIQQLELSQSTD